MGIALQPSWTLTKLYKGSIIISYTNSMFYVSSEGCSIKQFKRAGVTTK